jgi:hypothetical protein
MYVWLKIEKVGGFAPEKRGAGAVSPRRDFSELRRTSSTSTIEEKARERFSFFSHKSQNIFKHANNTSSSEQQNNIMQHNTTSMTTTLQMHPSSTRGVHANLTRAFTHSPLVLAMIHSNQLQDCSQIREIYEECLATNNTKDQICQTAVLYYRNCLQEGRDE